MKNKIYKLLRKSERYTKTDMVYLAKGGFWLTLGQIVSSLASFLLAIASANLLSKETYGAYKYILSLLGILTIPTLSGMGIAITRAVAQGNDGSFLPALKLKIRWGLLGGLGSLVLSGYYYLQGNIELTFAFLITTIFIPFMDSFALYSSLFQGKKKFDVSTRYGIITKITASLSIFASLYFTKNLLAILFIYLASYTLLRLIVLRLSLKYIKNKKEDPQTISHGKHLSFAKIPNLVMGNIVNIFIFNLLGAENLAIYSIALAPVLQVRNLINLLKNLLLPKFSAITDNEIYKKILKKIITFSPVIILIIIFYILFIPYFFNILFPQYKESVPYSQIISITILFTFIQTICVSIINSKRKIKFMYYFNLSDGILSFLVTLPMIYFFKLYGLIFSLILIRLIQVLMTLFMVNKISKEKN